MKIKLDSLQERIYKRLLADKSEMSSQDIAREFMKIEKVTPAIAEKIVEPVLSGDGRFMRTENGLWKAGETVPIERLPLSEISFVIFYMQEKEGTSNSRRDQKDKDNLPAFTEDVSLSSSFLLYKGGYIERIENIDSLISNVNKYVFIPYDQTSLNLLKKFYRRKYYLSPDLLTLSIRSLLKVLYPQKRLKNWSDLIKEFSIINVESDYAGSKTKTAMHVFEHLLNELENRKIKNLGELIEFANKDIKKVDFSRYKFDRDFLINIPEFPGIYIFYNREGEVIYIGKTNNLKRRINSYLWNTGESPEKIKGILNDLYRIEYKIMGSELEAIVEEYWLIKEFKPKFNTQINIPERIVETSKRIVLLPSIEPDKKLTLFFLCNGLSLIKEEFGCHKSERIIGRIGLVIDSEGYKFDPAKLLVINYLKRYGDNINVIEIDNYSDAKGVLEALLAHCSDINSLTTEKKRYL